MCPGSCSCPGSGLSRGTPSAGSAGAYKRTAPHEPCNSFALVSPFLSPMFQLWGLPAADELARQQADLLQSSLVRWGQYSLTAGPPSVLKRFTVAVSFAVGFCIKSSSSSPLHPSSFFCWLYTGAQSTFTVQVSCKTTSMSKSTATAEPAEAQVQAIPSCRCHGTPQKSNAFLSPSERPC